MIQELEAIRDQSKEADTRARLDGVIARLKKDEAEREERAKAPAPTPAVSNAKEEQPKPHVGGITVGGPKP